MVKYQQGDVLFVKVPEDKWCIEQDVRNNLEKTMVPIDDGKKVYSNYRQRNQTNAVHSNWDNPDNTLIVAHGEATGHSHSFNMVEHAPDIAITAFGARTTRVGNVPEYVNIEGGDATIKHEEHNALTIPAGHYEVSIVREWDHIAGRSRYVVD